MLEPQETATVLRLILVIDHHGVMCGGATEITAPGLRTVGEGPRIDENGLTAHAQCECQRIGVPVRGDRKIPERSRVGDEADLTGCLEVLAEDEVAAFGEGAAYGESPRGVDVCICRGAGVSQQPATFVVEGAALGTQCRPVEEHRPSGQEG